MSFADFDSLLEKVEESDVVELCSRMVRTRSVNPPGDELSMAELTAGALRGARLQVEIVTHGTDRASVLARIRGDGTKAGLLFSGHLDTVPPGEEAWLRDPFGGEVAEGKVWGRGSADMKGGLASMIVAAKILASSGPPLRGDLILALTAGEEVDSLGAVMLAERPDLGPVRAVVLTEPSSNDLFIAEKGALWVEVTTHGKTAHGSMPDLGRNAVMMMVSLLAELDRVAVPHTEHPMLGGFSRSINTVAGGLKTNVVPDRCAATVDMRTVPGQEHRAILRQIEHLIADLGKRMPAFRASLKVLTDRPPVTTPPDDPVVQSFVDMIGRIRGERPEPKGVRYFTDAVAFVPVLKAPMIICGPGRADQAHRPDEYVEISRLVESARILTLAAACLLT